MPHFILPMETKKESQKDQSAKPWIQGIYLQYLFIEVQKEQDQLTQVFSALYPGAQQSSGRKGDHRPAGLPGAVHSAWALRSATGIMAHKAVGVHCAWEPKQCRHLHVSC